MPLSKSSPKLGAAALRKVHTFTQIIRGGGLLKICDWFQTNQFCCVFHMSGLELFRTFGSSSRQT